MKKIPQIGLPLDDIWVYDNVLEKNLHSLILSHLNELKDGNMNSYESRHITANNQSYKLVGTTHYRPYKKLWQLSDDPNYFNQTNETIYQWAIKQYPRLMHPAIRMLSQKILQYKPFTDYPGNWILFRGIFNNLKPGQALDPHTDAPMFFFDFTKYYVFSATYYADVDGEGGEYWDERGFMHKPANNSLLVNNGKKYIHGVLPSNQHRLGITLRFIKDTDLLLPGNTNDLLYKPVESA